MPTRERHIDRGSRIGQRLLAVVAEELREARLAAGLSQSVVGAASGLSTTQVSRIERAKLASASIDQACRLASVLGMNMSVKFYPAGQPLRDQAHLELIERFRVRLGPPLVLRTEVPVSIAGDARAWDMVVGGGPKLFGGEVETRLRDWQALGRRITLKMRDSGIDQVILLISASRSNREALRVAEASMAAMFPIPARVALKALGEGRDPGGSVIIML
jgi:transcriptional regulator with XRE-family HTH domain